MVFDLAPVDTDKRTTGPAFHRIWLSLVPLGDGLTLACKR
jgi:hypothetical protein